MRRSPTLAIATVVAVAGLIAWRVFGPGASRPSQSFTTGVGERRTVDLADGTHVTLGPRTELRASAKFNRANRLVELVGEAFFDVHHDTSHAFQVRAFGVVTEDLGTSFNVRALADSVVRVTVIDGSASVRLERSTSKGATLNPGDFVALDTKSLQAHISRQIPTGPVMSWRTGPLEYLDTDAADIGRDLERWFGLVVRFDPVTIGQRKMSAKIPVDSAGKALAE
ncbi:MAG TPA: FecR domain-containing protein, partial [Gemmatimonadaceae bacterium]|nr:FecR domain-containing protein [Gemmatimonadaceae bacterium]